MYWAPKNRGRKLSAANKKKRVDFLNEIDLRRLKAGMSADSKLLYCYRYGTGSSKRQWQSARAKPKQVATGNPFVLHVYAVVGKDYKSPLYFTAPTPSVSSGLHKSKETFTADHFIKVAGSIKADLDQCGINTRYRPLILDHARQHTAKKSQAAMEAMGMKLLDGFPPQSWDLNIIENCWGILENKLSSMPGRKPTTIRGWRERVQRAWESISQSTINKLVDSLTQRVEDIKEGEGEWLCEKAE